jgi:hypothetical protein
MVVPEISGQFLRRSLCLCLVLEIRRKREEGMMTWMNVAFVMQRPLIYRVDYSPEHEKIIAIADLLLKKSGVTIKILLNLGDYPPIDSLGTLFYAHVEYWKPWMLKTRDGYLVEIGAIRLL